MELKKLKFKPDLRNNFKGIGAGWLATSHLAVNLAWFNSMRDSRLTGAKRAIKTQAARVVLDKLQGRETFDVTRAIEHINGQYEAGAGNYKQVLRESLLDARLVSEFWGPYSGLVFKRGEQILSFNENYFSLFLIDSEASVEASLVYNDPAIIKKGGEIVAFLMPLKMDNLTTEQVDYLNRILTKKAV